MNCFENKQERKKRRRRVETKKNEVCTSPRAVHAAAKERKRGRRELTRGRPCAVVAGGSRKKRKKKGERAGKFRTGIWPIGRASQLIRLYLLEASLLVRFLSHSSSLARQLAPLMPFHPRIHLPFSLFHPLCGQSSTIDEPRVSS